jgi:regulator of sigma D
MKKLNLKGLLGMIIGLILIMCFCQPLYVYLKQLHFSVYLSILDQPYFKVNMMCDSKKSWPV